MSQALPELKNFYMPFYYASLNNIWCYYLVNPDIAKPYVKNPLLKTAIMNGKAVVNFNFQTYAAQFDNAAFNSFTTELELNILVYPAELESIVPEVTFQQFLQGDEVTRFIGNHRVRVPANNPIAILAGKAAFGEPKFPGLFTSTMPSLNNPNTNDIFNTWTFSIFAPKDGENEPPPPWAQGDEIVTCTANLTNITGVVANPGPISYYGQPSPKYDTLDPPSAKYYFEMPEYDPAKKTIGARWNIQLDAMTYGDGINTLPEKTVKLSYGSTPYEGLKSDMETLIGDADCMAVQTFVSKPVAIESGAYYIQHVKK